MKKLALLTTLLVAGVAVALAPPRGSIHATSDTSDITRNFSIEVTSLTVAPVTQNVIVFLSPGSAQDESLTVNAGDVMTWGAGGSNVPIYGFTVERATATAVDIYWQ